MSTMMISDRAKTFNTTFNTTLHVSNEESVHQASEEVSGDIAMSEASSVVDAGSEIHMTVEEAEGLNDILTELQSNLVILQKNLGKLSGVSATESTPSMMEGSSIGETGGFKSFLGAMKAQVPGAADLISVHEAAQSELAAASAQNNAESLLQVGDSAQKKMDEIVLSNVGPKVSMKLGSTSGANANNAATSGSSVAGFINDQYNAEQSSSMGLNLNDILNELGINSSTGDANVVLLLIAAGLLRASMHESMLASFAKVSVSSLSDAGKLNNYFAAMQDIATILPYTKSDGTVVNSMTELFKIGFIDKTDEKLTTALTNYKTLLSGYSMTDGSGKNCMDVFLDPSSTDAVRSTALNSTISQNVSDVNICLQHMNEATINVAKTADGNYTIDTATVNTNNNKVQTALTTSNSNSQSNQAKISTVQGWLQADYTGTNSGIELIKTFASLWR